MTDDASKAAALETLQNFVAALSNNPPLESEAQFYVLPSSFALLSHPAANEFRQTRLAQMVSNTSAKITSILAAGATSVEEVIIPPGPDIWVHADLAAIWAGYSVRIDGVERARGVNAVSLLNVPGEGWKISGVADTQWAPDAPPPPADNDEEENQAMIAPIYAFLAHLKAREWDGMLSLVLLGGGATHSRPPAAPMFSTFPELIERVKGITEAAPPGTVLEEPIFDVQTRRVGELGFAWTPFVTTANGVLRSKGINVFTLLKRDGKWVITGIQDTATYVEEHS
ncbi:putative 1-aminocyclopropane-1-carboxylate deaminase [Mycena sanguinolenta]|uniref:Putative 1-aminocyclopropane-1-carboxylate deaminase n=1 Tax=Mycena sanguinolenta TaxID=230812 RepID=A0A8H6ZB08_9AGAR|nr:putative 1-aminocyclopropane-1-carboxylate deaminase [Mycena sanguinolenta]